MPKPATFSDSLGWVTFLALLKDHMDHVCAKVHANNGISIQGLVRYQDNHQGFVVQLDTAQVYSIMISLSMFKLHDWTS